jgi:hypothetical protein
MVGPGECRNPFLITPPLIPLKGDGFSAMVNFTIFKKVRQRVHDRLTSELPEYSLSSDHVI